MKKPNIIINTKKLSSNINKISLKWVVKFLKIKIEKNNFLKIKNSKNFQIIECILLDKHSLHLKKYKNLIKFPDLEESFVIKSINNNFNIIVLYGSDTRGLIYAITELADRIDNIISNKNILKNIFIETTQIPKTKIRSISKCFESNIEDLTWFNSKVMWKEYLNMLITNRFNRFTFTVGMQYNYPYGNEFIKDVYLYLAYPFLVKPKGYKIYAQGLSIKERKNNFEILKFISDEASKRGLEFQLAIWTQRYDFEDVPNANYQIKNVPSKYAEYCRDSLNAILKQCKNITGLTLRVHVESGIQERNYKFWKIYFQAIKNINREINIDLHAKGIDQKLINLALEVSSNVSVSPKYIAEHMGLPYHQTSIRKQEMPPNRKVHKKWIFSEGKRKFLRYSYGDLLKNERKYQILYRIWPGTQRILIWGDPELARGYGKYSTFCSSLGVEICEPLSFKGRMGTGIKNGRYNYSTKKLRTKFDWEKYIYTYRVWGRCTFNYETNQESYSRYFTKLFGKADNDLIKSLSYASKILPLFTLVHGVSASNNSFWPEIYENMSTVERAPHLPYSYDLHKPSRFGMATSQDPQLIMSPIDLANCIYKKKTINRYSPLTMANWLNEYGNKSIKYLLKSRKIIKNTNEPNFKRLDIDVSILSALGKFFSYKIKSSCYWEMFLKEKNYKIGLNALKLYKKSYNSWKITAKVAKKYYLKDLTYGPQSWLRGRWDDRLPLIKNDIIKMENILNTNKLKNNNFSFFNKANKWKNDQKFLITHKLKIHKKGPIEIIFEYKKKYHKKLFLKYRHVNQSDRWKKQEIKFKVNRFIGKISRKYLTSDYPIQYYFEFIDNNITYFCPGIDRNLSNQPYYIFNND